MPSRLEETIAEVLAAGQRRSADSAEKNAASVEPEPTERSVGLAKLAEALRSHRAPRLTLDVLSRVNQKVRGG